MPTPKLLLRSFRNTIKLPPDLAWGRWSVYDAIAPSLILLAPFVVFLEHNGYPYLAPETLLLYAGFTAVGSGLGFAAVAGGRATRSLLMAFLIAILIDVQFDLLEWWGMRVAIAFAVPFILTWILGDQASRIYSVVFATIVVSGLVLPGSGQAPKAPARVNSATSDSRSASDLPVLLHLVLDEHIGVEGIPSELENAGDIKEKLISFYESNGFRLFGRAYSEYYNTWNSISHFLNFSPNSYRPELVSRLDSDYVWRMSRNEYLRRIWKRLRRIGGNVDIKFAFFNLRI